MYMNVRNNYAENNWKDVMHVATLQLEDDTIDDDDRICRDAHAWQGISNAYMISGVCIPVMGPKQWGADNARQDSAGQDNDGQNNRAAVG